MIKRILLGAGLVTSAVFGEELVSLGTMDASFWRSVPMPDRGHFYAAPVTFPGSPQDMKFLEETDFPYQFEKYGDVPGQPYLFHADEVILVRFLGGWDKPLEQAEPFDLAYRDDDGVIQLRRDMLKKHFAKYEESGAVDNYTVVLDNVPYCFPENAGRGPFGQVQPPADFGEWHDFIVEVCKEIKSLLGEGRANDLRFRLGTEMQGSNRHSGHNRFNGNQELFFSYYRTTAQAVKSVLPDAKFGPWNIAAIDQGLDSHLVNYRELAVFCAMYDLPLDFVGHSLYTVPLFGAHSPLAGVDDGDWNRLTNIDPEEKVSYYTDFWRELKKVNRRYEDIPYEIHEFGVLDNELALPSTNMDSALSSRDAANMLQVMFRLKKAGLSKCVHWGMSCSIPGTKRHILNSNGWLLQVLDHTTGGEIWELPVRNHSKRSISKSMAWAFFDCDNGKNYIVLSTFNPYRYIHMEEQLELEIPTRLFDLEGRTARVATLDVNSSPQRIMRNDLAAANLLSEDYLLHPDFPPFNIRGLIPKAVTDVKAATALLKSNEAKYIEICKDSLTLKEFTGEVRLDKESSTISVVTRASSILVLEIN
ncbi:GH39 family glycosyl hydrolase [Coraliomargarita sp. W4R72]